MMVGRGVMWMELFTVMVFVMSVLMICFMVRVISVAVAMVMSGLLLIRMVTIDHNSHNPRPSLIIRFALFRSLGWCYGAVGTFLA